MTTLNDTMGSVVDTAKHTVDSAKKGTERAASVALSDIADGIRVVTGAVSLIRSFGVDDALGWLGLSRRRGTFESVAIFGSGVLVGAGMGIMLAPMSGSDLRKAFLTRLQGVEKDAENVAGKVKDAVVSAERKVEDIAGNAKDSVAGAAKDIVEGAEQKVNKAKDALASAAEDPIDDAEQRDLANKTRDAVDAAARKADIMSDKAKDAIAADRQNNGLFKDGHHRHAARHV